MTPKPLTILVEEISSISRGRGGIVKDGLPGFLTISTKKGEKGP